MSYTSCAKEVEEPGHGGSRAPRNPKSIRKKSLRHTKIEVDDGRSDEKDQIASYFNRLTSIM